MVRIELLLYTTAQSVEDQLGSGTVYYASVADANFFDGGVEHASVVLRHLEGSVAEQFAHGIDG